MISLKRRNLSDCGFTIVELLIVIVVIIILVLLVIMTYSGIRAKARNAKRQEDIKAIHSQLEAFFSQNGYYPSYADMDHSDFSWIKANMKGLDTNALIDPSSNSSKPTLTYSSSPDGTSKSYEYYPTTSDGQSCENTDTTCAKYTLIAKYEGTVNGQNTYTEANLD